MTEHDEFTPEVLVRIIIASLEAHDTKGCEIALRMLAVRDPYRAEQVVETMRLGISLADREANA